MLKKLLFVIALSPLVLNASNRGDIDLSCSKKSLQKSLSQETIDGHWSLIKTQSLPTGRHECDFVEHKGKFYLLGGRGIKNVDIFDPKTNTWQKAGKTPFEIHHFQAVSYNNAIYIVGAMTGKYPLEKPLENIWIYYPEKDLWVKDAGIPKNLRRGGAGTVVFKDKLYQICGITLGHTSGTTNIFNSYDFKTGEWERLTAAPHIRDHFFATIAKDKLYVLGGRNSSVHYKDNFNQFFLETEDAVDVYDFATNKWHTMKTSLPQPTAAAGVVATGEHIIYIGGEGDSPKAFSNTQCLDLATGKWSQLSKLNIGRHGCGAIFYDNKIYVAAGSDVRGGGNISSIEVFTIKDVGENRK